MVPLVAEHTAQADTSVPQGSTSLSAVLHCYWKWRKQHLWSVPLTGRLAPLSMPACWNQLVLMKKGDLLQESRRKHLQCFHSWQCLFADTRNFRVPKTLWQKLLLRKLRQSAHSNLQRLVGCCSWHFGSSSAPSRGQTYKGILPGIPWE